MPVFRSFLNGLLTKYIHLRKNVSADDAPELHFIGLNGRWLTGIDVANNGGAKDFVPVARYDLTDGDVTDLIYIAHNGQVHATTTSASSASTTVEVDDTTGIVAGMVVHGTGVSGYPTVASVDSGTQVTLSSSQTIGSGVDLEFENTPTIGLGVTPPTKGTYRVQISAPDSEPPLGGLGVRIGASQTGDAIRVYDSNNNMKWKVDSAGYSSAVKLRDASTPAAMLEFYSNALGAAYRWAYATNSLRFSYATGGVNLMQFDTDGTVHVYNTLNVIGTLKTGTHTAIGAETVTGFITIKDSAGNDRKIAVVS